MVEALVREFIQENFLLGRKVELKSDDRLLDGGVIDSFGLLSLITFLEEQFGIQVCDEEVEPTNFQTLAHVVALVSRKAADSSVEAV
ncbi:hypothetical protein AYO44_17130 [Planctomycetaceae bacterium SCGC AG-212-F19]|nr:hypothetical protein AYO44_17130 [Planctomycetaceae bacterium SCGC AG-212-F19]